MRNAIEGFQGFLFPSPARDALPPERGPRGGTTYTTTGREAAGQVCPAPSPSPARGVEETAIAWLIPLVGHATRYALGFAVGEPADSALELDTWSAVALIPSHYRDPSAGVIVHQERDPASTG